jgi:hypothetical protein
MWPWEYISHTQVYLFTYLPFFFPVPPIKLKLGWQIGGRLVMANHLDQSVWWANQKHWAGVSDHIYSSLLVHNVVVLFTNYHKLLQLCWAATIFLSQIKHILTFLHLTLLCRIIYSVLSISQRCWWCDPAKTKFTSKVCFFIQPHLLKLKQGHRKISLGTTNSKPPEHQLYHIYYTLFCTCTPLCRPPPKCPKIPFSWAKPAHSGFFSCNFTVQDHILSTVGNGFREHHQHGSRVAMHIKNWIKESQNKPWKIVLLLYICTACWGW